MVRPLPDMDRIRHHAGNQIRERARVGTSQYPHLLEPFRLRHLTFRNRLMSTSHAPGYVEDRHPKLRYQLYHEEKAKGGLALTMFGGSSNVAPDSPSAFGQIWIGDDTIIPVLREFSERVHRHGCAIMCQITHMGHRTLWNVEDWLPPIAPSPVREHAHRSFPKEMDRSDIRRVVRAFGDAALRCRKGGLDGVELLAYGHLIHQFWTPLVNRRTDEYGGSLENRARFGLEVLEEVRRRVGGDFVVGFRMMGDELKEGGLGQEDCLALARIYADTGMCDFMNVVAGQVGDERGLSLSIPSMAGPRAPFVHIAARMRRETGIAVFHATRIMDLATAEHCVREGLVDMVAMTRAHMADPHIVAKMMRGEEERIRPCVGAGYCIDRIYVGGDALCLHNPATGRERTMPHVIGPGSGPRRKVVVVGAGPAGLEAARVSALRGHEVVVFEAASEPGGQIVLAARATWRSELLGIAQWLAGEAERLGVALHLNRYAEAADVLAERPDIVITATGGVPNLGGVAGAEHAVSVWDVLGGQVEPGAEVLVFDDHGDHPGPSVVDFLATRGSTVELVTPDRMAAHEVGATNYPVYLASFYSKGVSLTPDRRLRSVEPDGNRLRAVLRNEYSDAEEVRVVDQVVVEHGTVPAAELFRELAPRARNEGQLDIDALIAGRPQSLAPNAQGEFMLFRVGDAVASRNIHAAIYDSLRLCKEL